MSAPPGWYPDPAGQPDLFRYWDGQTWTATTSLTPSAGPPPSVAAYGNRPGTQPLDRSSFINPAGEPRRSRSSAAWILGAIALAVVLAVVIVVVVIVRPSPTPGGPGLGPDPPASSAAVCPPAGVPSASPPAQAGARVSSGKLSYPRLGAPFNAPSWDRRVPFGRDVQHQQATVEEDDSNRPTWVASVLIARLLSGDGFYGPKQGASVIVTCITGLFYGEAEVNRKELRSEAVTVDGKDAWLVESQLSFDLTADGIMTKGELLIVVVVDTADGEAGLFYASIPDTSPQFEQPARDALAGLQVSG